MEQQVAFFLALVAGFIFGAAVVWLILRSDTARAYDKAKSEFTGDVSKLEERLSGKESRIEDLMRDRDQLKAELEKRHQENSELRTAKAELSARLSEAAKLADERLAAVMETQEALANRFKALSAEALESNNQTFLNLAQQAMQRFQDGAKNDLESRQQAIGSLVEPLRESLGKVDSSVRNILQSHAGVQEQVRMLVDAQNVLRTETSKLANALRNPGAGGRWGEMQLRRVVEMAGMDAHCDFEEQSSFENETGRQRPDLVVHLPGRRQLAIDAKVSLNAYLEALETEDAQARAAKMSEHAGLVRAHLRRLGSKQYWAQLVETPEFVVAFLPGEAFFAAALEGDPKLIEYGVEQKVILATPTTLIALLKAVAYGWRQEQLAENAREISDLGQKLYQRLYTFTQHLDTVRSNLQRTVEGYNRAVGSLESRVLVSARRFQQLGAGGEQELGVLDPVDTFPRSLQAVEAAVANISPSIDLEALQPELPGIEPQVPRSSELADDDSDTQPEPASEPEPEAEAEGSLQAAEQQDEDASEDRTEQILDMFEPEPELEADQPPIIEWTAAAAELPADIALIDEDPGEQTESAPVEEAGEESSFAELDPNPEPAEPPTEAPPSPEPFAVSVEPDQTDSNNEASEPAETADAGASPDQGEELEAEAEPETEPSQPEDEPAAEPEPVAAAAPADEPSESKPSDAPEASRVNGKKSPSDDDDDDPKPLLSSENSGSVVQTQAVNYVAFVKAM